MAKKPTDSEITAELAKRAALQDKLGKGMGAYLNGVRELGELYKNLNVLQGQLTEEIKVTKDLEEDIKKLYADRSKGTKKEIADRKELIKQKIIDLRLSRDSSRILKADLKSSKEQVDLYKDQLKQVNKVNASLKSTHKLLNASSKMIRKGLVSGFKKLSRGDAMGWAKDIKMAQLNMGITSKQTDSFHTSLQKAGKRTASLGVSIERLAKGQGAYSDELGRAVELGNDGLVAMAQIGEATGLGTDGAAQMVAQLDLFNISALGARDIISETVDSSTEMGLNSSKVIKNLQSNLKLAQKYHFKGGIKGLTRMAQYATKMGVDMGAMAGMADSVFRPEGAVEMAAKLQTMGGAFSKIADPFQLMFKARNDFEGFSKDIGNAAKELVTFGKDGEAQITGLQLDRLREIAKITGVAEESLSKMAYQGAKFDRIKSYLPPMVSDEDRELLANIAVSDDKGGFQVKIGSKNGLDEMKNISDLNKGDLAKIRREGEALDKRVEDSKTFDEAFKNLLMGLKTALLPLLKSLNESLAPMLIGWTKSFAKPGGVVDSLSNISATLGETFSKFAKTMLNDVFGADFTKNINNIIKFVGKLVTGVTKFVGEFPILTAALVGILTLGGPIISLGLTIATLVRTMGSFVRGMRGMMSSNNNSNGPMGPNGQTGNMGGAKTLGRRKGLSAKMGRFGKRMGGRSGGMGLAAAGMGIHAVKNMVTDDGSGANIGMDIAGDAAVGAGIGGMILPGYGHAIGGAIGAGKGVYDNFYGRKGAQTSGFGNIPEFHTGGMTPNGGHAKILPNEKVVNLAEKSAVYPKDEQNKEVIVKSEPIKVDITIHSNGLNIDNMSSEDKRKLAEVVHKRTIDAVKGR